MSKATIVVIGYSFFAAAASAVEWKAPGANIAAGKACTFNDAPAGTQGNFGLTKGNDEKDLTDGALSQYEMMWLDKGAVGWTGGPQFITIDLGAVTPISGVGYHTGSRAASGIGWPPFILVMVSEDGKEYRLAGELVGLSSKFGAPTNEGRFRNRVDEYNEKFGKNPLNRAVYQAAEPAYWFRTDELNTQARYVRFAIQNSIMIFTDEVEVYAGKPGSPKASGPVIAKPIDYLQANKMPYAVSARQATDAARAIELVNKLKLKNEVAAPIIAKLDQLRTRALAVELKPYDEAFRAIVPLSPLHAEIYAALSAAYRAAGYPEYSLWHNNPWARQAPFDLPPALADGKLPEVSLDVYTLHNDRRGEVMNLGNFSDGAKTAVVTFTGLPGGAKPEYVRVRQAEYLAMQSRVWDADVLPLAEETGAGWKVSLPAGVSRQLWFDFKPDTKNCPAGKHEGQVVVQVEGGPKLSFPITLTVANYRLPDPKDRALSLGFWDYMDMGGPGVLISTDPNTGKKSDNFYPAIKHMQESGVNVAWGRQWWASRGTFPRPSAAAKGQKVEITQGMPITKLIRLPYDTGGEDLFDAQGNLRVEIDFTAFDTWVKDWPGAKYYAIYAEAYWDYAGIKGKDPNSADFTPADKARNDEVQRRLGVVMKKWAEHMPSVGVKPSQIVLLMVDEVAGGNAARMSTQWAKGIKQAVPEFKIYLDPTTREFNDPSIIELFGYLDVITPGTDYSYHWKGQPAVDFYDGWRQKGKILGFYSCAQNPSEGESTAYFRTQQWDCWRISKGGPESWAGIWAYVDFRGVMPWNPLPGGTRDRTWATAYIDSKSVTDGKHWLAIFEGANDYAYLHALKNRIAELEKSGTKSAEIEAAKKVLEEVPDQVVEDGHFQNKVDACDVGRMKVFAALQSLAPAK
jgi:hypothetical protein